MHKKKLRPEAIASMMAEADTDKDGEVDLEEFKLIMRGAPKAEKEQVAAERAAAELLPPTNPAEGLRRSSVAAVNQSLEKADLALAGVKAAFVTTAEDREKVRPDPYPLALLLALALT